jgi:hypothetical protein
MGDQRVGFACGMLKQVQHDNTFTINEKELQIAALSRL